MKRLRCSPSVCFGFILLSTILPAGTARAALPADDPAPDPRAVVIDGEARFTILTDRLVRMEWAPAAAFEDHASLVFINRRLPAPPFTSRTEGEWLMLKTGALTLRYRKGSGRFTAENLSVEFQLNGKTVRWMPGMADTANLKGTTRTLDGVQGTTDLEPGLLSRDGWVVVDDTQRPLYDTSDWPWVVPRVQGERQDLYFFGYGHAYKDALYDFTRVAGRIPMPPRFAFGVWWSRYWSYTDEEFKQLVREFEIHDVPLNVLVIDMDWHLTFNLRWDSGKRDQAGQTLGWTGYTWDHNYFPDPQNFLSWCADRGLRTPLNIHPASGIQPHEDAYPAMARAMGIDPTTRKYVPFDIVDKKFTENYMSLVMHPLERQGVDFWWLDWQQWGTTKIPGVTPTWWLNYVFFTDMQRQGKARPLLFHRWGGLGNHRYQIGFSGDAISVWESLAFQSYFTSTAANVGFGYWSHDIGGHMPGPVSAELYTRWIQFGAFSPILRTHTTKNPDAERRIWAYPVDDFLTMRDAFLLRYSLIPYIYTYSRHAFDTGISLCRPMYYDYPEASEAYAAGSQYMFGDRMLVAPIAAPLSRDSLLTPRSLWLPQGEWIEWHTGSRLKGPAMVQRAFGIDEIPVYVKAGSIIPMQLPMRNSDRQVDPLVMTIFPGDTGSVNVYEDQGNTDHYREDECSWTPIQQQIDQKGVQHIVIGKVRGSYPGMLANRSYEIRLENAWPPEAVTVNGVSLARASSDSTVGWRYDGDRMTTHIRLPRASVLKKVEVAVTRSPEALTAGAAPLDGARGLLTRLKHVMPLVNKTWPKEWSPEILVDLAQTGNRMSLSPASAPRELQRLHKEFPMLRETLDTLNIAKDVRQRVLNHLAGMR